jgi:hypothetical protein
MTCLRVSCVLVLLGSLAFFVAWQRVQTFRLGYELERLEAERRALERERERLRFEAARLRAPGALAGAAECMSLPVGPPDAFAVAWLDAPPPEATRGAVLAGALPTPRR